MWCYKITWFNTTFNVQLSTNPLERTIETRVLRLATTLLTKTPLCPERLIAVHEVSSTILFTMILTDVFLDDSECPTSTSGAGISISINGRKITPVGEDSHGE